LTSTRRGTDSDQQTCLHTTTLDGRQQRCVEPNVPSILLNSTRWPHQIVNTTCPRFAMLKLNPHAGLGHRLGEVGPLLCNMLCDLRLQGSFSSWQHFLTCVVYMCTYCRIHLYIGAVWITICV
jgi:hypothetical protein